MKAGTSQKLILNLFSTTLMVKQGRTFGNLMSHMRVANEKLQDRAIRIVMEATSAKPHDARQALSDAGNRIPIAILLILSGADIESCIREFEASGGRIRIALRNLGR
jgi:N-acetylmuramic acid 6-phosphate etherase